MYVQSHNLHDTQTNNFFFRKLHSESKKSNNLTLIHNQKKKIFKIELLFCQKYLKQRFSTVG